MLTEADKHFYSDNGYLHVPDVITSGEIATLSDELDWIFDTWANHDAAWQGPWRERYMTDEERASAKLVAINDMHLHSDVWNRITGDTRIVDILTDLIGPDVELHHTTLHAKPPEIGSPFPLHQDNGYGRLDPMTDVTIWLPLVDTNESNGGLLVVSGSHQSGLLEHGQASINPVLHEASTEGAKFVPLAAGEAVAFPGLLVHGSGPNRSREVRPAMYMRYCEPQVRQLDEGGRSVLESPHSWMVAGEA